MRNRFQGGSKSGLFLLEMTLVVFFFALTSAVYVRVFASAQRIGRESKALTEATMIARNLAEGWYAAGGDPEKTAEVFSFSETEGNSVTLYYDSTFRALPADRKEAAFYRASILPEDSPDAAAAQDTLLRAKVIITPVNEGDRIVYELPLACFPEAHAKEGER